MESLSNRINISSHFYSRVLQEAARETEIDKLLPSYRLQLEEWVAGDSMSNRDCYLAVMNNLMQIKVNDFGWATVLIDCQGLDSRPPLPTTVTKKISLVLKGQPNITLHAFLTDIPSFALDSLTFCDNETITAFSSENIPWHCRLVHIKNCPNFTSFEGRFTVDELKLSNMAATTLSLRSNNFPCLYDLLLHDNSNLMSIQVKGPFSLKRLTISGNHNNLAKFPLFPEVESLVIDPLGLASISDYSWLFSEKTIYEDHTDGTFQVTDITTNPSLCASAIELLENHYKEGKVTASLTLIKMAEAILTGTGLGLFVFASDATYCLTILLGESAAASFGPPELVLGKLFLDGKLVERNVKKADKFFQLALDREKDPVQKEILRKIIEFLPQWDFYQKVRLFSLADEATNLPSELRQLILSLGRQKMIGTGFMLRQQRREEKLKHWW
ncbi:MAG: hypothetical protein K0R08_1054 [Solimicrobium sp.]|jgi:hypothetical protein|nr:hypothetical protein [Solimicrobium sp.]